MRTADPALWYGRQLHSWVISRTAVRDSSARRLRACMFEACRRLQRASIGTASRPEVAAVIIGLWRSGTTLLHELLSTLPSVATPTTDACFRPASFRLLPGRSGPHAVRPMDSMPVHPDSPQEDEFALLLLGAPTPYRGFLAPQHCREAFDEAVDDAGRGAIELLQDFLALFPESSGRGILLKSPPHLFRLDAIHTVWPTAAAIYIARDPVELFWSNLRMWSGMMAHYAGRTLADRKLEAFVAHVFHVAAERLDELGREPDPRLLLIDYDQLARDPVRTVAAVARRLFRVAGDEHALEAQIASRLQRLAAPPRRTRDPVTGVAKRACDALAGAQDGLRTRVAALPAEFR